jgi:IS30 family transposase
VENWAEIRRLHRAEGVPIKEIGRRLGVARNTVRVALASDRPPAYRRARRGVNFQSPRRGQFSASVDKFWHGTGDR